jgi:hypothetical protein
VVVVVVLELLDLVLVVAVLEAIVPLLVVNQVVKAQMLNPHYH